MPNIFGGLPGRIAVVDSGDDFYIPLGLVVGDFKTEVGIKCLLTGLSLDGQSGYQVMHTLRTYIYVYVFGERAGEITVSGLCFNEDCAILFKTGAGLARLFDWYERNRISTTGAPITLTLCPGLAVQGFLTKFRYQIEDPSISLGQFQLQFFYPPRIKPSNSPALYPPAPPGASVTSTPAIDINLLF